jgi:carboxyl-terminal processing protease
MATLTGQQDGQKEMSKKKIVFLSFSVALLLSLVGGAVFGQATQKNNLYRYLSIFSEVFDLVRSNYVEQVSSDQLMDGAFSGVTDAIDEFSYYVPPAQMASYRNFVDSEDSGVGIVLTKRFGYAFVISAVAGSPAAKAGVERGDFIEKIDDKPTARMAVWQIRDALRSRKPMQLQIIRGGQTKREALSVQPVAFHPLALETKTLADGVSYIRIPYFEKGTSAQLRAALQDVHKAGQRKLIIDVRGNAGGDVEEAINSADELLTSGMITSLEGRRVEAKRWQADRATDYDGDVEVLTDGSTAAGAEVFAAAVHGNNRGKTVGLTTYGKSIIQKFIPLPSGGGVQMTIGHYTTPDLKPIKDGGVKPDVLVDMTSLAIKDPEAKSDSKTPKEDLILEKALSLFGAPAQAAQKKAA